MASVYHLNLCLLMSVTGLTILFALVQSSPLNHQTTAASSPISISLPLPLASVPQPVTITKNSQANSNNNDVIGYIVLPYPGIDQRADISQPNAPLFSLLGPGSGSTVPSAGAFAGLARSYRRFSRPSVYNPLYYNPINYGAFPGYGIYGYNARMPFFNLLG